MPTITATETGYSGTFSAVSTNTAEVTVSPATSSGTFTLDDLQTGYSPLNITVSDTIGHSVQEPVDFGLVCLP